ncbi:MAG: hypothetical protein F7C35_03255 [Desulfurococcales archaeon]|nr:hypothetical protein [Desulfurococcales archaeon]
MDAATLQALIDLIVRILSFPYWHVKTMIDLKEYLGIEVWLFIAALFYGLTMVYIATAEGLWEAVKGILITFLLLIFGDMMLGVSGESSQDAINAAATVAFYGWVGSIIYGAIYKVIPRPGASTGVGAQYRQEAAVETVFLPSSEEELDCFATCYIDCVSSCPPPVDRDSVIRSRECRLACGESCRSSCGGGGGGADEG